jgi:hypothetical protein
MSRKISLFLFVAVLGLAVTAPAFAASGGRPASTGVIYVQDQGLYYDVILGPNLPAQGPFQKLVPGTDFSVTQYGPGDPGYLGGRWWVDVNGDNQMDPGDLYFLCPLLGPGRTSP